MFAIIPIAILLYYGIEDKNAWFFGHDYINDYRYRIGNNGIYHIGVMVSHYSLIVALSIVAILVSWIIYEGLKLSGILIRRFHFELIFHMFARSFAGNSKRSPSDPTKSEDFTLQSHE
jgi:hypothetical protein